MNALLLVGLVLGQAGEFEGRVVSVHDGDTARVEKADGTVVNVRFLIGDAPEIGQPGGIESRDFMRELIHDKDVTVRTEGEDEHGRTLGEIFVGELSANEESIRQGHAWWFYHFDSDPAHGALEVEARQHKRGLFAAESPLYPRAWRRGARIPEGGAAAQSKVFIMALMPNPAGEDDGNETVTIANRDSAAVDLGGWTLADDDGGSITLTGTLSPGGTLTVRLTDDLTFGNTGDVLRLADDGGIVRHSVQYESAPSGRFVLVGQ